MTRTSSFVLTAVIAATSILAVPAMGQFSVPKIKVPKIVKKDTAATPDNSDPVTSTSDRSSPARAADVRGVPIRGATMTFSNSPDGSNPKATFTSAENIYGRIDFGGRTMYDTFGWKAM